MILSIALGHNGIKLEISIQKVSGKFLNIWKLSNKLINNPWVQEEIIREIGKYFELNYIEEIKHEKL